MSDSTHMEPANKPTGKKKVSGALIAAAGMTALIWGFSFTASDILLDTYDVLQVQAIRWVIAAVIFVILGVTGVVKLELRGKPKKWILLTAIVQPCIYAILETYGIYFTSASMSSVFIATIPSAALILGALLFHRKPTGKVVLGIVVAFAGVVVCTVCAPGFAAGGKVFGYLILIATVFAGGIYTQLSKEAARDYSSINVTACMAFLAAPWFLCLNFAEGHGLDTFTMLFTDWRLLAGGLFLGVFCSAIAYLGYNYVIAKASDPATAGNLISSLVTVTGVLAGVTFRGDAFGLYTVIGVALTLIGVVISSKEA